MFTSAEPQVLREVARAILHNRVSYGYAKDSLLRPREEAEREVLDMLAREEGASSATPELADEPAWVRPLLPRPEDCSE